MPAPGLPSLIPPGMRAVSVRVNEVVSVAGFVTPGTRVDVLLTGTPGATGEQETTTVLQNVAVLASGHTLERTATGEAQTTAVITLLVSPDDAQRLTLASSEGHIQLALRNPLDTKQDEVPSSNSRGLYRGLPPPPTVQPIVHHTAMAKTVVPVAPPPSTGVRIEVYQGDKKPEVVKCSEENCGIQLSGITQSFHADASSSTRLHPFPHRERNLKMRVRSVFARSFAVRCRRRSSRFLECKQADATADQAQAPNTTQTTTLPRRSQQHRKDRRRCASWWASRC